ncbi:MAG TPA: LTA synthase family protein [Candidatus Onthocola stercoravium]|nr:LTA synthase family protein [Candidatus Onthocola stercoravium]
MKKYKLKKFNVILFTFIILMFLELSFRILTNVTIFNISFLYVTLYNIFVSLLISFLVTWGNNKFNKVIYYITIFIISFIYALQLCIYKMFGFYFDLSLLSATDQVASFAGDGLKLILENIVGVIVLFLPFIILLIFIRRISIHKNEVKINIIKLISLVVVYLVFIGTLYINGNGINSAKELYFNVSNNELNIRKFGVLNAFRIDVKRSIFGFEVKLDIPDDYVDPDKDDDEEDEEPEIVYEYNNLDIDFDSLIASESNSTIKMMHEYFKNESGTLQNEYTKYFEGKNLILFMAESFNEIAVREDITPTLYKLVNSGFKFNNFYTPTISSTIGGEFQELTGLVAASGFLSPWKSGENYYPFGVATAFQNLGYNTYAYHNHTYTFQSRHKYLAALGFDNYMGCRNGLENEINCNQWPESDVEMIEATFDDYIANENPFMVYYVTVSGHGDYGFNYSAMARKHKDDVANLNYSEKPLSYLAAQIELDQALELLIKKLDEAGELEDTVIALVGDHYPYYLSLDEVNEIASYEKDSVVEINRSNFILWNSEMETVEVEKIGSQIDVLPTIYNLFGVEYDSRLIIGKDILSTEPGLAIFGNSSWVSDKGTYFASSGEFVSRDGVTVDDDYIRYMNSIVSNKITMSRNIMKYDYYRKVLGE